MKRNRNYLGVRLAGDRLLAVILVMSLGLSMLAGCGKKKDDTDPAKPQETETVAESQDAKDEGSTSSDAAAESQKATESETDIYKAFIEGSRKCAIKKDDNGFFDASQEYTLDEMLETLKQYNNDNYILGNILEVQYAYFDAAIDWKPQLVIRMDFGDVTDRWVDDIKYLFFDCLNGNLQYCGCIEGYYRSYVDVNEYGYISVHGSNGAGGGVDTYKVFTADGDIRYLYCNQYYLGLSEAAIPDYIVPEAVRNDPEWPGYDYAISDRYYFVEGYNLVEYNEDDMTDDEYLSQFMFVFTDPDGNNATPDFGKQSFYREHGIEYYDQKDMEKIIQKQLTKLGVTDKIKNGDPVDFAVIDRLSDAEYVDYLNGMDSAENNYETEEETKYFVIDNPSWEYYDAGLIPVEPGDYYQLVQESVKGNNIVDTYDWFYSIGVDPDALSTVQDGKYYYSIYGNYGDNFKPNYLLDITDRETGDLVATLDFSNYIYSEDYLPGDYAFIDESVRYAQSQNGVLYVSIYHSTYAESAPHNAYIVALDMNNDYRVLWKTQPLTCNSDNFVVLGNMIFCGYGFTAEPDYIYLIDIETGVRTGTVKVATAADYFILSEDASKLYVRTYNKDYVFNVKLEK